MFSRRIFSLLTLALVTSACGGGTETGNPSFAASLSYTGYSSSPKLTVGPSAPLAELVVDSAWLSLGDVSFARAGKCELDSAEALRLPALGVGDHAAGAHNFTPFRTEPGSYCEVELPFERVPEDAQLGRAPAELEQHTILVLAHLADGTPLRILSAATPRLSLTPENAGFELSAGGGDLLMTFDFAAWLGDLDFANAFSRDGTLEISASANPALLAAFEANLERGVALFRDRDGDGRLDDDPELLARGR